MAITNYFSSFPLTYYTFTPKDNDNIILATNIIARIKFRKLVLDYSVAFYDFVVADGATPEILAANIYGNSRYHYIILLANNIINPYT